MGHRPLKPALSLPVQEEVELCLGVLERAAKEGFESEDLFASATRTAIRLVRNAPLEAVERLMRAFEELAGRGEAQVVARFHAIKSNLALREAKYDEALVEAELGRQIALISRLEQEVAYCCSFGGSACLWSGRLGDADRWFDEAVVAARRCGDRATEAGALSNRAILLRMRGESESSLLTLNQASEIFGELGNERKLARCGLSRGILYTRTGSLSLAEAELRSSLAQFQEFGQIRFAQSARLALARALTLQSRADEALVLITAVQADDQLASDPRQQVIALEYLGDAQLERGEIVPATASYREARERATLVGTNTDLFVETSHRYALALAIGGGAIGEVEEIAWASVTLASTQGDRFEHAAALCSYGRGLIARGSLNESRTPLGQALELSSRIGDRLTRATAALALSRVTFQLGDPVEAAGLAHEARREFAQLPSPRWLAETETWLTELMAKLATAVASASAQSGSPGLSAKGAVPHATAVPPPTPAPSPASPPSSPRTPRCARCWPRRSRSRLAR